jgi:hypothetical protein
VGPVGILTIALGDRKYARQARWLARSIRRTTQDIPLAVATDRSPEEFDGLFDLVVPWRLGRRLGAAAKLDLFDITPFDTTLFLDADCFCVRSPKRVIDYFAGHDFGVYGSNTADFHWGEGTSVYRTIVDAESYPSFNGGLYYFRKSPLAREVFARAQHFSANYHSLSLTKPRGMHNDELLVSLAMASLGIRAIDKADCVVMVAPEPPAFAIDIDLLRDRCAFPRRGRIVQPEIVHFVGGRDRLAAYRREGMVLDLIVGAGWPAATRPLLALAASAQSKLASFARCLRWSAAVGAIRGRRTA